jgi:exodeoxyribonuclease V gamma subunit
MEKQGEINSLRVIYGNDLSLLAKKLGEDLFSPSSLPFENRLVVAPNPSVKDFLFQCFFSDPNLKIAAGIRVLPLNQAVLEILDFAKTSVSRKKIPSFLELSLAIEEQLHSPFVAHFSNLSTYLDLADLEKRCRRISTLSDQLARLFTRYGLYGQQFLPAWLSEDGWQQVLWNKIFSSDSPWTYPIEALQNVKTENFQGKIALFGFSHLSLSHLKFFYSLSASLYQLSPCSLFWEDHVSDKERLFVQRSLHRKGVKKNVREEIGSYMGMQHALLGNWGKLGREMLRALEAFVLDETQIYQEQKGQSLLNDLRRSLLTLDESCSFNRDDSIQLHSATSKLREVEILRDTLETLLQKHAEAKDAILPREILVLSPDIFSYAPYIQMVFAQSSFAFAIEGLPLSCASQAVQGFLDWFHLFEERFSLTSITKLLHNPSFMQKNGFRLDEVDQLCRWFKQAEIRAGLKENWNSWEKGLDRLLSGLALTAEDSHDFEPWPIACIPQSEIELFDRFLKIFNTIQGDVASLSHDKKATEWFEFFLQVADKYFFFEWEKEPFFQELKSLMLSSRSFNEKRWDLVSIQRVIKHLAQKPVAEISSFQLQKITFTSLQSGNLLSGRIIWCLGMNEGDFPRSDARSSLCEMSRFKTQDYFPLKTEEDRSLFLEMLVNARDYLIFSYVRMHPEDGKHQGPSLLIEELNHYLRNRGILQGIRTLDHPAFALDQIYFSSDALVKKWSETDYVAAKAHYSSRKPLPSFFALNPTPRANLEEMIIDIRQLKKLARNPLQFYFNETLKMYLKEEQDEEEAEFLISYLRKSFLRKKALHLSLPQVMKRLRAEGKLPVGLFQEAAIYELEEELKDLREELSTFGVSSDEIRSINLSLGCLAAEKNDNLFPALAIPLADSKIAYITGTLEDVCPQGLLYHGDNDLKSLLKAWPLYLIYRCLDLQKGPLLLTKSGKVSEFAIEDPKAALASYLEYYQLAQKQPSPFMPDWASAFSTGKAEDLKVFILKDSDDPYLNYLKRREGLFDPFTVFQDWNSRFHTVFFPITHSK